jgi:Mg2+-importing ATPase
MRPMRGSPSTALSTWLRSRPASCCVRGTRRAGASLFLPFLPLLANQIPRNKFLSDIPGMAIASDDVDREWIERPHRWDIAYTRNFMILFGLVSSVFDYLTFGVLAWWLQAAAPEFQTGWFIESLMTELLIVLVIRTRRPFFRSRPGTVLLTATLVVAGTTVFLPYSPLGPLFGFVPLPPRLVLMLVGITGGYLLASELVKHWFFRRSA